MITVHKSGEFRMNLATFQDLDHEDVCFRLGLNPAKPWNNAAGEYVGPRGRKSRRR